jgi:hypothetical protein
MPDFERVTVTLPSDLVREISRWEKNRDKFIAEAVRRELQRRRRAELRRSLDNPHPESTELAGLGFTDWVRGLPGKDAGGFFDAGAGRPIRWVPGEGWVAESK